MNEIFTCPNKSSCWRFRGQCKKILNIASKASSISADFVLTPELSLWGYPANDLLFKKNLIKNQYQILDKLALDINKKYGHLSISMGSWKD